MRRKFKKNERGQAMVEMALVLPIFLCLVCGIIDFGWLFYNQISLNNAAREGARYAVVHYEPGTDWKENALLTMESSMVGVDNAVAVVSDPSWQQIKAEVSADVHILTGLLQTFLGKDTITLEASCVMRLEN
ncbi:MAG: pilus assembly protein [Erysipelotrichaceae bacterium]|nr:pilus assembly protein [Erysipelotrichaceae bacterium]